MLRLLAKSPAAAARLRPVARLLVGKPPPQSLLCLGNGDTMCRCRRWRGAHSSRLTFSPTSENPALEASINNCRFRELSARGLRVWTAALRFIFIGLLLGPSPPGISLLSGLAALGRA